MSRPQTTNAKKPASGKSGATRNEKQFAAICNAAAQAGAASEAARQLSPDLARALARAGLFTMFVPQEIGGQELSPLEGMARLEKLAMHDAASAWVSMIGATAALGSAYIDPAIGAGAARWRCVYCVGPLGLGVGLGQC